VQSGIVPIIVNKDVSFTNPFQEWAQDAANFFPKATNLMLRLL
jgi:hypothetical protein